MIGTFVTLIILLAAFSLLWWGINSLSLPPPVKTVVLVIFGLIMLAYLYNAFGGHVGVLR